MAVRDDFDLRALLEEHPVERDGRQRDDRRQGGQHDEPEIDRALPVVEIGEGRLEGEGEQEAGEDLGAGLHDPELLEHFDPVAIGPLEGGLVAAVVEIVMEVRIANGGHVDILTRSVRGRQAGAAAGRHPFQSMLG
jgi:hypothetical protein